MADPTPAMAAAPTTPAPHTPTSAWPLAWAWGALIVYASLFPFSGWRDLGLKPWDYLLQPLPHYWSRFDVVANAIGYAPFGFLLALAFLRRGARVWPVPVAILIGSGLSLLTEGIQTYLPTRVASNADWLLNSGGTLVGASLAVALERMGVLGRWNVVRARWFVPDARGALVLLALWPPALLYPASVPLGLGQILERLEAFLTDLLIGTPYLEWLPVRAIELQPMLPSSEMLCVALGYLAPVLLMYSVTHTLWRRALLAVGAALAGIGVTALSVTLSSGPDYAWGWLHAPVIAGGMVGGVLAIFLLVAPRQLCLVLLLPVLVWLLALLNDAAVSGYHELALKAWQQGRFMRFHGLTQWIAWTWPYITLLWAMARLTRLTRFDPFIPPRQGSASAPLAEKPNDPA